MKAFKKLNSRTEELNRVQDNVETAFAPLLNVPLVDGVRLQNVILDASITNEISHGLGRIPLGYLVIRKRADSRIWDLQDANRNKSRTLALACSADVEIDLWVF